MRISTRQAHTHTHAVTAWSSQSRMRAKERLGWANNWGVLGRGEREGRGGREKRQICLTRSKFCSLRVLHARLYCNWEKLTQNGRNILLPWKGSFRKYRTFDWIAHPSSPSYPSLACVVDKHVAFYHWILIVPRLTHLRTKTKGATKRIWSVKDVRE